MMHYPDIRLQPIVSLSTHQVFGYEILSVPQTGTDNENRFSQCSNTQLLQLREWQLATLSSPAMVEKLFVNLTTDILLGEDTASYLLHNRIPGVIELQDPQELINLSDSQLKQLAVHINRLQFCDMEIWVDDYQQEYGSTLHRAGIMFDGVKIDRFAFQRHRHNASELSSLIREARCFGKYVLVEGVETPEDMETATHAHADLAQGFYWPEHTVPAQLS